MNECHTRGASFRRRVAGLKAGGGCMRGCVSGKDLSAFIDSELPPNRMEAVAAHVRTCRVCADYVESLREQVATLKSLPAPPVRNALAANVRRRIVWQAGQYSPRGIGFGRYASLMVPRPPVIPVTLALVLAFGAAVAWFGESRTDPKTSLDGYLEAYVEDYDAYQALMSSEHQSLVGVLPPGSIGDAQR